MNSPFHRKLLASHLLVALIVGLVTYGYLSRTLAGYVLDESRTGLLSEARLARLTAVREIADLHRDGPAAASAIAGASRARVTLISRQGNVVGDSEVKTEELKDLDNHLHRPEVQEALKSGEGIALRYSATLRMPMLYVALPVTFNNRETGILRLALPLASLEKAKMSLHAILAISLAVALLISLVLSYLLSNVISRSLRSLTKVAEQIGTGESGIRIKIRSRDEVGKLATVMNDMAMRIEEELKRIGAEKNRLDAILRGMGEGLMVSDTEGAITLVNPAFRSLFAIQEEVEGKALIDITRHPSLHEAFKAVVQTKTEKFEEITLNLNGERTVMTHLVPLMKGEILQGVVAVFHDISVLKRLENIRRDFVANVSHELRTPVTVIRGYAETLLDGAIEKDPANTSRFLEKIQLHAKKLSTLINDLLTLSELETGEMRLEMIPLSVDEIVRHVCAFLDEKTSAKRISVKQDGIGEAPHVLADRCRLEQILVNLVDNAVKYTPEQGSITISAKESQDVVRISVSDTGIGIPLGELSRIFERFYRVDDARSLEMGGSGLGLSIVKHLVQSHGGAVFVESIPGKGSTFSFTLKRA